MIEKLYTFEMFDKIYIMSDAEITRKTDQKLKKLFTYKYKILKYVEEEFERVGFDPSNNMYKEIFVFLDYSSISHYFMIQKYFINLIEDGMDIYYKYHEGWRIYLNYLFGFPRKFGLSKYIKKVWVLYPAKLPQVLRKKSKLYDIAKYKEYIDNIFVNKMIGLYLFDEKESIVQIKNAFKNKNIFLLLTQSYSEFGHMTEEKKIDIYKKTIKKYARSEHSVVIKTHPKETTDYSQIFPDYTILPGSIPIEIISDLSLSIDICISINSTASLNLDCNEKIMIEGEFNEEGWAKYMKQLNVEEN
jgi:hypothetical protein